MSLSAFYFDSHVGRRRRTIFKFMLREAEKLHTILKLTQKIKDEF
jgi:hypothetical protein